MCNKLVVEADKAREVFQLPGGFDAITALGLGSAGNPSEIDEKFSQREAQPRQCKALDQLILAGQF